MPTPKSFRRDATNKREMTNDNDTRNRLAAQKYILCCVSFCWKIGEFDDNCSPVVPSSDRRRRRKIRLLRLLLRLVTVQLGSHFFYVLSFFGHGST